MVLHVRRTSTVSRFSMARFPPSSRACQEARRVFRLIRESLSVRLTDSASITKHTKRCGYRRSHNGGTILSTIQLFHSYKTDLPKVNLDNDDLNRDPNLPRIHGAVTCIEMHLKNSNNTNSFYKSVISVFAPSLVNF